MTQEAERVLAAFEALSPLEQREVAVILLKRTLAEEGGELEEQTLLETADSLFLALDQDEAAVAEPKTR